MYLVCRRAPPFRNIHSFLSCRVVCPFLYSCSCLCPCQTCLCPGLCLACLCPCPCQACLWFCRPCQTIHSFSCFASFRFSFDNLLPCDHKFHTMNNFLGTCALDCSVADKSIGTSCVFLRANSTFSISFINFAHSAVPVDEQMIPKTTFLQTFDDNSDVGQI